MDDEWYYAEARTQRGPVDFDQLKKALASAPEPRRVYVWHEGMAEWQHAGDVDELRPYLVSLAPPAVPTEPLRATVTPEPPGATVTHEPFGAGARSTFTPPPAPRVATSPNVVPDFAQAEAVARYFRRLILLVGLSIVLSFSINILGMLAAEAGLVAALVLLATAVAFAVGLLSVITAYQLSSRLGSRVAVLWALGMLIPVLSFILLIALSIKTIAWFRARGIDVGLLGPTKETMDRLRRQAGLPAAFG